MKAKLELHVGREWVALYVDGSLDVASDRAIVHARIFELAGVKVVEDDSFMSGQHKKEGVAKTVAEVDEYRLTRLDRREQAAKRRTEAARLIAEAEELEK